MNEKQKRIYRVSWGYTEGGSGGSRSFDYYEQAARFAQFVRDKFKKVPVISRYRYESDQDADGGFELPSGVAEASSVTYIRAQEAADNGPSPTYGYGRKISDIKGDEK